MEFPIRRTSVLAFVFAATAFADIELPLKTGILAVVIILAWRLLSASRRPSSTSQERLP